MKCFEGIPASSGIGEALIYLEDELPEIPRYGRLTGL
jgi:hypothetical protein